MTDASRSSFPLLRRRVLVTASRATSVKLADGLARLGAEVILLPTIEVRALESSGKLEAAIRHLCDYQWIVFTSSHAVDYFLRILVKQAVPPSAWAEARLCAVGPTTALALESAGFNVSLIPQDFRAEGVVETFTERSGGRSGLSGLRILFPCAREARDVIPRMLGDAGAQVDVVPCYETVLPGVPTPDLERLRTHTPDLLIFTSPSTITNFIALLGEEEGRRIFRATCIAALGPVTAQTSVSLGKAPEILPAESTIPALLEAIAVYFESRPD